mmetsp:Transcript_15279/g.48136  ORF Transcript_15279/g.48136 Transcript_15279/m.48136 type:complete len:314 (-) Transcript_15279:73-1014(-)
MQRLFEAAFSRPRGAAAVEGKHGFAILPQQSEDELVLSMVHSKLDRVLAFLQSEIGYVLLDDARPCAGGGVQLREAPRAIAKRGAKRSQRIPQGEPEEVKEEEARQVIRFSPNTAKYAHYPDDLVLVWRFVSGMTESIPSIANESDKEVLCKAVLQGMRLMHLCSYNYSDLVVTLAYASVYFRKTCEAIGNQMSGVEAAHVCVLLVFLAHCFVIDETCPLRYWQKYVFRKYCTLKVLDAALFRLLKMRDFRLRISDDDEQHALSVLLCSTSGFEVILSNAAGLPGGVPRSGPASTSSTAASSGEHHEDVPDEA